MQQAQVQAPAWQYAKWLNSPYHRDKQVALRHAYENLPLDQLMGFFVWVKHFWNVLDHREKEMAAQIRARIINEANALTMQGYQIQIPAGLLDPMIGNPYAYPAGLGGYAHQGLGDFWADFSKAAGNAATSAINFASQQATNALNQSTTQSKTNDGWDFDIPGLNQNTTPSTPQGQPSQQGAYYDPYEMGYQPQGQPQTFQYGPQPYTPPATAPATAPTTTTPATTTTTPATTTAAGTTATVPTAAAASSWKKYIPWAIGAGALYLLLKPRRRSAYRS